MQTITPNPKTRFSVPFIVKLVAVLVILAGIAIAVYAAYASSSKSDNTPVFANRTMLAGLWNDYKNEYWEESTGRTIDKQSNNITTSEGQSYTMLRAVWQSDKATFDKSWGWTQEQLQREDNLFSWRWGKKADGTYGILTDQGGQNTASDADSDIALALVMAASRWQQSSYLDDAKAIITSMWQNEVVTINGTPYFAANDLEKDASGEIVVNPSYIAPYAYRVFARIDQERGHDWNGLIDASYALLDKAIDSKLDRPDSAGLVPDWVVVNKATGEIAAPGADRLSYTTNYGYEAFRTPWRLALDYTWNKAPEAKQTLEKMSFLGEQWSRNQRLVPIYTHDGQAAADYESSGAYGGDLGYFIVTDPDRARDIYTAKLRYLYDANDNGWKNTLSYYDDNWAWFGMALYTGGLDNLAADA